MKQREIARSATLLRAEATFDGMSQSECAKYGRSAQWCESTDNDGNVFP